MTNPSFTKFAEEMAAIGHAKSVVIDIPRPIIFSVIATIQLASRHPAARGSSTVREAVELARQWQQLIFSADRFPAAAELLEMGWSKECDRSLDGYAGEDIMDRYIDPEEFNG